MKNIEVYFDQVLSPQSEEKNRIWTQQQIPHQNTSQRGYQGEQILRHRTWLAFEASWMTTWQSGWGGEGGVLDGVEDYKALCYQKKKLLLMQQ